jgi:hypothetical protein
MSQIYGETPIDESVVNSESTKEQEPKKKAFLIYRDNGLFRVISPAMVEGFSSLGYQVIEHSFPEGTAEEDMAQWAEEHASEITGNKVLHDTTFARSIENHGGYKEASFRQNALESQIFPNHSGFNIDRVVSQATAKLFLGDAAKRSGVKGEYENDMELTHQSFVNLVKKILEDPDKMPRQVLILKYKMLEHDPFSSGVDFEEEAADTIAQWLAESGINAESIANTDRFDEEVSGQYNQAGNWIMTDRHYLNAHGDEGNIYDSWAEKSYPHNAKLLQIPLGNFYLSAKEEKLLIASPQDLQKTIPSTIRELGEQGSL